jgi:hypothetical protein
MPRPEAAHRAYAKAGFHGRVTSRRSADEEPQTLKYWFAPASPLYIEEGRARTLKCREAETKIPADMKECALTWQKSGSLWSWSET